jgi:hypothetical protein
MSGARPSGRPEPIRVHRPAQRVDARDHQLHPARRAACDRPRRLHVRASGSETRNVVGAGWKSTVSEPSWWSTTSRAPSAAQRDQPVSLQVVDGGPVGGPRRVAPARGRPLTGLAVDRASRHLPAGWLSSRSSRNGSSASITVTATGSAQSPSGGPSWLPATPETLHHASAVALIVVEGAVLVLGRTLVVVAGRLEPPHLRIAK